MKKEEFNKLLKQYKDDLEMIIRLYCMNKIYLTNYQLEKVLKMRGEENENRNKLVIKG